MFKKLFSFEGRAPASPPAPTAQLAPGKRIYAIGDIHGSLAELDALLARIAEDAAAAPSYQLVFLGDYVDRGPDANGVLTRLIEIERSDQEAIFLKGNHEEAMLNFLIAPTIYDEWLDWGGRETIASYAPATPEDAPALTAQKHLIAALPDGHHDFLERLELSALIDDYFFVHAGVRPGVALDAQESADMLWIRSAFHDAAPDERPDKVVIHGHQPVKAPEDKGWRVNVDTGACWSGILTAVALEEDRRWFVSTNR